MKYIFISLFLLCSYSIFSENSDNIPEDEDEFPASNEVTFDASERENAFSWFNMGTLALTADEYFNVYIGCETIFLTEMPLSLPLPFRIFGYFFNVNLQYQFITNDFFIRSQNLIHFPWPILLGIDFSYNINSNSYVFSQVFGICLFYPGWKIMFKKDIFKGKNDFEVIMAIGIPFYVLEK
jgi:hypothetical protein